MYIFKKPKPLGKAKKRSTENQRLLDMLNRFIDDNTSEPVKILVRFWKDQEEALTYKEIREMVEEGSVSDEELENWSIDYSNLIRDQIMPLLEHAAEKAKKDISSLFEIDNFDFNTNEENVTMWIKERGASLVTRLVEEQRDAVQSLIYRGYRDSVTPAQLARTIRPCIGLTKPQANAVYNYKQKMIDSLKKEHPRMKLKTIERKAEESARKYSERLHRYRADTIAQTELANAYNTGVHQSLKQAQEKGYIGHVRKVWVTARQDNVCKFCESVEGVSKEMDEYFDVGKCGMVLIPPAHPRCRCVVKYVEVKEDQR